MNQNPIRLNQLVLRQMLLEGNSGDKIIKAVRKYNKGDKSKEELVSDIRKEVTLQAKVLLEEDTLSEFISSLSKNV